MRVAQTIFLNGMYVRREDAAVSVFDHGFLYGDGIFEGIRVYQGNVFRLQQHLDRLYDSAKSILLKIPYPKEQLSEAVCETVLQNGLDSGYIRLVVTRGTGNLGLDPFSCSTAGVIIIAEPLLMFAKSLYDVGISVISAATRRNRGDVLSPKVKSLNYLNNILIKMEAKAAHADEALVLNTEGYVVEGSGENVFLVKNKTLYTPPTYLGALGGITRECVMELAREAGYTVREEPFVIHDVYVADEVFLTGTAAEVVPVVRADGRVIGDGTPGVVTKHIHQLFHARTLVDGVKILNRETEVLSS